jgi:hypothetical protein
MKNYVNAAKSYHAQVPACPLRSAGSMLNVSSGRNAFFHMHYPYVLLALGAGVGRLLLPHADSVVNFADRLTI